MIPYEKLDARKIEDFRNYINGNNHFVLNKYRAIDGINKWSIICSCMDWITVAVDYINSANAETRNENIMSMQVYSTISAYDIIVESVLQLHRVFFQATELPYAQDTSVFNAHTTDYKNFKNIRAVFGAHPVNLKDILEGSKGKQYYASWSTTSRALLDSDVHVFLYSKVPGDRPIEFGVKFSEMHAYVSKYYQYLDIITEEISKQYRNFLSEKKRETIERKTDILDQVKLLKIENKKRNDNDYYGYCLDLIDRMLSAECTHEENEAPFNEYKLQLVKVVDEIYQNLQNMKFSDLITASILDSPRPMKMHYDYEKLFNYINGEDDGFTYYMFPHHYERVFDDLSGVKKLDVNSDKDELLLLINAGLYFANKIIITEV